MRKSVRQSLLSAALLGSLVCAGVHAQAAPGPQNFQPVPWSSLSPAQRDVLAPLQNQWNTLPPKRQSHLLEKSQQWVTLPPERREKIRERIAHWQTMTPEERQQARENMRLFRQLPPEQRAQLHSAYERFQQLPPEQRQQLMRQWHAMPPAKRVQWLHGDQGHAPMPGNRMSGPHRGR